MLVTCDTCIFVYILGGVGGNSVCPRETPSWQKPITNFFIKSNKTGNLSKNIENKENCDGNIVDINNGKNKTCESENETNTDGSEASFSKKSQKSETVELIDKNANEEESSAAASASEDSVKTSEPIEAKDNERNKNPDTTELSPKNNSEKQKKVRASDTNIDKPAKKIKYEELCKNLDALEKGEMFL